VVIMKATIPQIMLSAESAEPQQQLPEEAVYVADHTFDIERNNRTWADA